MSTQPNNMPEEYAVIRAGINAGGQDCGCDACRLGGGEECYHSRAKESALAALDRLAAREVTAATDAGASAMDAEDVALLREADVDCELILQREEAIPPAPPAAECAARNALEIIANLPHDYPGDAFWFMQTTARAALATPCQHGEAQSEIAARIEIEVAKRRGPDTICGCGHPEHCGLVAEPPAATDAGASALEAMDDGFPPNSVCEAFVAFVDNFANDLSDIPEVAAPPAPPAPPAAECAARKALKALVDEHEEYCEEDGLCGDKLINDARAALATPCQHGSEPYDDKPYSGGKV